MAIGKSSTLFLCAQLHSSVMFWNEILTGKLLKGTGLPYCEKNLKRISLKNLGNEWMNSSGKCKTRWSGNSTHLHLVMQDKRKLACKFSNIYILYYNYNLLTHYFYQSFSTEYKQVKYCNLRYKKQKKSNLYECRL